MSRVHGVDENGLSRINDTRVCVCVCQRGIYLNVGSSRVRRGFTEGSSATSNSAEAPVALLAARRCRGGRLAASGWTFQNKTSKGDKKVLLHDINLTHPIFNVNIRISGLFKALNRRLFTSFVMFTRYIMLLLWELQVETSVVDTFGVLINRLSGSSALRMRGAEGAYTRQHRGAVRSRTVHRKHVHETL